MAGGFAAGGNYYKVAKSYSGASAFSVSTWIYYPTASDDTFVAMWETASTSQQWILSKNASNQIIAAIFDNFARVAVGGTLTTNAWNHIAMTYTQTGGGVRLFLNGSQVATATVNSGLPLQTVNETFGIGARQAGNGQYVGRVAEVATWGVRLTADQIGSLADGFSATKVLKPDVYVPLVRNVQDQVGNIAITTVGTPTVENHPRIY